MHLADTLIRTRPIPDRLLARLRVTTPRELLEARSTAARIRHEYLAGREPVLDDLGMPRDTREDSQAARERDGC